MKEQPAMKYEAETGKKAIVATMADESKQRLDGWCKTGCNAFDSARPMSKPISFWTEQDVLEMILQEHIEIASVYGKVVKDYKKIGQMDGQISLEDFGVIRDNALARLLIAQEQYIEITEKIRGTPLMVDVPVYETKENPDTGEKERVQVGTREVVNGERERLMIIQDRCMKQCRQGASDFGMTVSSRCRLVVPKPKETKPENKFAKYGS